MNEPEKLRLLFVDDDINILNSFRRAGFKMKREWEVRFALSGGEALAQMRTEPADVVISDYRMPDMDGVDFLRRVEEEFPATMRLMLSGVAEKRKVMRAFGPVHQFLPKPCGLDDLRRAVSWVRELRRTLTRADTRSMVLRIESLPSVPEVYARLMELVQSGDYSAGDVASLVALDPAASAKMLQLVNSAYFGLGRRISDPAAAVKLLGTDSVVYLVVSSHILRQLHVGPKGGAVLNDLWRHSLRTAELARRIVATFNDDPTTQDDAFFAGLEHDLGKLVFLDEKPDDYCELIEQSARESHPLPELERERFGADHSNIGAYILGLWGLSPAVVQAVAFHHYPSKAGDSQPSPLTAVHAAEVLERVEPSQSVEDLADRLDIHYLEKIGLKDQVPRWIHLAEELPRETKQV